MTTRVSTSLSISAILWLAFGAASGSAFAQSAPKGTYVFSETGTAGATLASLIFAEDGSATGSAVVQQGGSALYAVQGSYVTNADNSKTLTLTATSVDA